MKIIKNIILASIFIFSGCSTNDERNIDYYKVEEFKVCNNIYANIPVGRERYSGELYVYEMILVNQQGDTIQESYATKENIRFIPGDTIHLWYGRWMLK